MHKLFTCYVLASLAMQQVWSANSSDSTDVVDEANSSSPNSVKPEIPFRKLQIPNIPRRIAQDGASSSRESSSANLHRSRESSLTNVMRSSESSVTTNRRSEDSIEFNNRHNNEVSTPSSASPEYLATFSPLDPTYPMLPNLIIENPDMSKTLKACNNYRDLTPTPELFFYPKKNVKLTLQCWSAILEYSEKFGYSPLLAPLFHTISFSKTHYPQQINLLLKTLRQDIYKVQHVHIEKDFPLSHFASLLAALPSTGITGFSTRAYFDQNPFFKIVYPKILDLSLDLFTADDIHFATRFTRAQYGLRSLKLSCGERKRWSQIPWTFLGYLKELSFLERVEIVGEDPIVINSVLMNPKIKFLSITCLEMFSRIKWNSNRHIYDGIKVTVRKDDMQEDIDLSFFGFIARQSSGGANIKIITDGMSESLTEISHHNHDVQIDIITSSLIDVQKLSSGNIKVRFHLTDENNQDILEICKNRLVKHLSVRVEKMSSAMFILLDKLYNAVAESELNAFDISITYPLRVSDKILRNHYKLLSGLAQKLLPIKRPFLFNGIGMNFLREFIGNIQYFENSVIKGNGENFMRYGLHEISAFDEVERLNESDDSEIFEMD